MSSWTYVNGVITVAPFGRTQAEKKYVLDTVLEHLPLVTGSEGNMEIDVVQPKSYNYSSSHNEFDEPMPFRTGGGQMLTQSSYMLVVSACLRDRVFIQTLREFNKWINRLAKRVGIYEILVRISGQDKELIIKDAEPYFEMKECLSWYAKDGGEPAWIEYLLWEPIKGGNYPMKLAYKYYEDPENDAEVEHRMAYRRG